MSVSSVLREVNPWFTDLNAEVCGSYVALFIVTWQVGVGQGACGVKCSRVLYNSRNRMEPSVLG